MSKIPLIAAVFVLVIVLNSAVSILSAEERPNKNPAENVLQIPKSASLFFTENKGQFHEDVSYQAKASGATFYFLEGEVVYVFTRTNESNKPGPIKFPKEKEKPGQIEVLSIVASFVDSNKLSPEGENLLKHYNNYFLGNDSGKWYPNVPNYGAIRYEGIYDGIDLRYYGSNGAMKYDFIVFPGAGPDQIEILFDGIKSLKVNQDGELEIETDWSTLKEKKPVIYQIKGGNKVFIPGEFKQTSNTSFGFQINEPYDPALPLIIDPALDYSTYLGGSDSERPNAIAVDSGGNTYITGYTISNNFPTKNPYQGSYGGGSFDSFVTKLSSQGNSLVYSTYLGGNNWDTGYDIFVDSSGNAYITGKTESWDFPTKNPYQGSHAGGYDDAFITKLSPQGNSLVYSTYLGGSNDDSGHSIAIDPSNNIYVTGWTDSTNFPTKNPYQGSFAGYLDAFVTKLNPQGNDLVYSTYLGGSDQDFGEAITIDSGGNAYILGTVSSINFPTKNPYQGSHAGGYYDVSVTKLNPQGNSLVYSTYLGGSSSDFGRDIVIDSSGNAYITGDTQSTNFPTKNPYQGSYAGVADAFVTKLSPQGNSLVYSTYLGGSDSDWGSGIAIDSSNDAYITGSTGSSDFPTKNPCQGSHAGGYYDVFVTKFKENKPPFAYFIWSPSKPKISQIITFDAYPSSDPDGYIVLYEWDWNSDGTYDYSSSSTKATYSWPAPGNYSVTLRVTDNEGATDTKKNIVSVTQNQLPIADFTWTPSNPEVNQTIQFDGSLSSDPDGFIASYEWDWDNDGVYDHATSFSKTNYSWSTAKNYPVTLRVTDFDGGADTETKIVAVTGKRFLKPLDSFINAIYQKTRATVYDDSGEIDSVTEVAADVYVRGYEKIAGGGWNLKEESLWFGIEAADIIFSAVKSGNMIKPTLSLIGAASGLGVTIGTDASIDQALKHWEMTGPLSRMVKNAEILIGPDFEWMRNFDYASGMQTAIDQGYSKTGLFTGTMDSLNGSYTHYNDMLAYEEPVPGFSFPETLNVLLEQNRWLDGQIADGMIITPDGYVQNYKRSIEYGNQYISAEKNYEISGMASNAFSAIGLAGSVISLTASWTGVGVAAGTAMSAIGTAGSFIFDIFETTNLKSMLDNWAYTQIYWTDDLQNIDESQDRIISWLETETNTPKLPYTSGKIISTDIHHDIGHPFYWVFANQPELPIWFWWVPRTSVLKDNDVTVESTGSVDAPARIFSMDRRSAGQGISRFNSIWPEEEAPAQLAPGQSEKVTLPYTGEFILLEALEPHLLDTYLWMGGRIVDMETNFYWILPFSPLGASSFSQQLGPSCCVFSTGETKTIRTLSDWSDLTGSGKKIISTKLGTNETAETSHAINDSTVEVTFILTSLPSADADLHVFDELGRHVGFNESTGQDEVQIPGASYSGSDNYFERIEIPTSGAVNFTVMVKAYTSSSVEAIAFETPSRPAVLGIQPAALYMAISPNQSKHALMEAAEAGGQANIDSASIAIGELTNIYGDPLADVAVSIIPDSFSIGSGTSVLLKLSVDSLEKVSTHGRPETRFEGNLTIDTSNAGVVDIPISLLVLDTALTNINLKDSSEPTVQGVHVSGMDLSEIDSSGKPGGIKAEYAYSINSTGSGTFSLEFSIPNATTGTERMQAYEIKDGWVPVNTTSANDKATISMEVGDAAVVLASIKNTFNISIPSPDYPWSLLSLPMRTYNTTLPVPVESILGDFEVIYAYNSSNPSNPWISYAPERPPFMNSLKTLDETQGFWVKMKNPGILENMGIPESGQTFKMKKPWNIISYPSLVPVETAAAFQDVENEIDHVLGYDSNDAGNEWKIYDPKMPPNLNTLKSLEPGFGYWVKMLEDSDWEFNGTAFNKIQ